MMYTLSKKSVLLISIFVLFVGFSLAKQNNTICTMEYAPVCASVQVECIKAPCPSIEQTFGNKCQMNAAGAKFLYEGECGNTKPDLSDCETYFDGCNNCSVVDGEVSACTLMYCEVPKEAKCVKHKDTVDLSNCETYFDGCNNCSVVDGKIAGCTKMYCQEQKEAKCINYKDQELSMANPASVYCEKNGGNLEIKSDENGGQYGICNFDNGSSCEERAFYRGECSKTSPVEKYISGYINKNADQFPDFESKISFLQNLKNKFTKTYRNIANSIQNFIEMLYSKDYQKKKITLNIDGKSFYFSLQIPKSRTNKHSENIILDKDASTFMFKYNPSKLEASMIFNITVIKSTDRENLVEQGAPNAYKIIESDGYVFYYSRALDMPYTGKHAEEYGNMVEAIQDIIDTFKLIQ